MYRKKSVGNGNHPFRPAYVEVDLNRLQQNFAIINRDCPPNVRLLAVVKDQAYGHGAVEVARVALEAGAVYLATATLDSALELRQNGITAPILLFGECLPQHMKICIEEHITCCVNDTHNARAFSLLAARTGKIVPVHIEVDTGLSRYGVRWTKAMQVIEFIANVPGLILEGVMSHFAMSDELDKSFALQQLERFKQVLDHMAQRHIQVKYRHMCNTGGFLDLPHAHFDMVRIGILPLGIYPSQVCRRIPGLQPVMSVKTRIAVIRDLECGDTVGYGMRYRAESLRRIAVLPIGYGDGFPRLCNKGHVLVSGQRAPIIGGNAMDAMMIDITDIPQPKLWDEVVIMGRQGNEEISVHEIAQLKGSVSYDILAGWSWRLPRVYSRLKTKD
ncbi:MAG: alanine racemase [bacterium]